MKTVSTSNDNVGGLSSIYVVPTAVFNRVKTDFSTGKRYVSVASTEDVIELPVFCNQSFMYEENPELQDGGDAYDVKIQGVVPRLDTEPQLLRELERGEWLVMHQDKNGGARLSGTVDVPLRFSTIRSSGNSPAALNGHRFTFSAVEPCPSVEVEQGMIVE